MKLHSLLLGTAVALAPLPALAEWTIDKSHATILFEVGHLGFSTVTGHFAEFDGDVGFDPEDLGATTVSLSIQADSINTFWGARDEHIRGGDFLDVANHPEITFVSTGIEVTGDNTATLTGDVTIRGTTNPIDFDVTMNKVGPNPFNAEKQIAGFTISGVIDRTDFGVEFGVPAISAEIPVSINVELVK